MSINLASEQKATWDVMVIISHSPIDNTQGEQIRALGRSDWHKIGEMKDVCPISCQFISFWAKYAITDNWQRTTHILFVFNQSNRIKKYEVTSGSLQTERLVRYKQKI